MTEIIEIKESNKEQALEALIEFGGMKMTDLSGYYEESGNAISMMDIVRGKFKNQNLKTIASRANLHTPKFFEEKAPNLTPELAVALLRKNAIPTINGNETRDYLLPTLQPIDFESTVGKLLEPMIENADLYLHATYPNKEILTAKTLMKTWAGDRPASYKPTYELANYDREFLNIVGAQVVKTTGNLALNQELRDLHKQLAHTAETYVYTNGTPSGQIGRLRAVMDVVEIRINENKKKLGFQSLNKKKQLKFFEEFFQLPNAITAFNKLPSEVEASVSERIEDGEQIKPTQHINLKSDAGILFYPKKRMEVIPQEIYLSDRVIDRIQALKETEDVSNVVPQWCYLYMMKNKAEIYEIDEYETKTRNIYASNSFIQIPAQMIFRSIFPYAKNFLENKSIRHVLKMSVCYGGLNRLIEKMSLIKDCSVVYADNLYRLSNGIWQSFDGSKMEASHSRDDILLFIEYILSKIKEKSTGWIKYATQVMPTLAVGGVAIWQNQLIPVPFLTSGVQGTAYYNTAKMAQVIHTMEQDKARTVPQIQASALKNGVVLKIEQECDLKIETPDGLYPLDFLGFDGVKLPEELIRSRPWIPVLNKKRLLNSSMFMKSELSKTRSSSSRNVFKILKMKTLYYLGGWFYPGLAESLRAQIVSLLREVLPSDLRSGMNYSEILQKMDLEDMEEVDRDALEACARGRTVPTLYDVFSLFLSENHVNEFVTAQVSAFVHNTISAEKLFGMIPPEQIQLFAQEYDANKQQELALAKGELDELSGNRVEKARRKRDEVATFSFMKNVKQVNEWLNSTRGANPIALNIQHINLKPAIKDSYQGVVKAKGIYNESIIQTMFLNLVRSLILGSTVVGGVNLTEQSFFDISDATRALIEMEKRDLKDPKVQVQTMIHNISQVTSIPASVVKTYCSKALFEATRATENPIMVFPKKGLQLWVAIAFVKYVSDRNGTAENPMTLGGIDFASAVISEAEHKMKSKQTWYDTTEEEGEMDFNNSDFLLPTTPQHLEYKIDVSEQMVTDYLITLQTK